MFDARIRKVVDPFLEAVAEKSGLTRLHADQISIFGFAVGVLACVSLALGFGGAALGLLLLNRVLDGFDGIVARKRGATDRGGFLDIVLDFIFYSGYVFAFALSRPEEAIYATFLIFSFVGTGTAFLAFAIFEQRLETPPDRGSKAFKYIEGITEGAETIAVFVLFTIFPSAFPVIASIFGTLCLFTAATRTIQGFHALTTKK